MSLNTSQPFTRAEALAGGLTDVDLRSRRFQRLFHGLYVRSGSKIGVHQMAAAALHISPPGSFASHETAAALWGAFVGELNEVHVSVPKGSSRSERRGIVAHRARGDQNPRRYRGLLVSDPTRVFLEVAAARKDLVDLVALGDSLVRRKRTTPDELVEAPTVMWARDPDSPAEPLRTYGQGSIRRAIRDCECSSCWVGCPSHESTTSFVNRTATGHSDSISATPNSRSSSSTTVGIIARCVPIGSMTSNGGKPSSARAGAR